MEERRGEERRKSCWISGQIIAGTCSTGMYSSGFTSALRASSRTRSAATTIASATATRVADYDPSDGVVHDFAVEANFAPFRRVKTGDEVARFQRVHHFAGHRRVGRAGQDQHDALRAQGRERLSVEDLAAKACMSPRNFARLFQGETGTTPAKAVMRLRAETARAQIESGGGSVQEVARNCGFGDPERMRRTFVSLFGVPPTKMRR